ncbi:GSCOCG00007307001-RA-CDS [Cotesia congregata]|uniref:Large ribosomal subunit protein mL43 n=1 Tax=Cotesia congregata TaxID=51543 RepID=A0A8J2EDF6_COTCN|nr:GSCOCG00007307001-RA-CDS [Cotesia congregata]CAG5076107.1 Similar to MRPL43: 39S ribosomal protein L43 [Cotesia congregata]
MSNRSLVIKSGFLRAPLSNGIGRYVGQLQRITLKFCKSHPTSKGMRDFLENHLLDFAKENPGVVVYVKPRRHRTPVMLAEYLNGEKHWVAVKNFESLHIQKWLELMRTQAQDGSAMRLRKMWHTEFPSIQGPWSPFTFMNPISNITKFPDNQLGAAPNQKPTATEILLKMYQAEKNHPTKSIGENIN